MFHRTVCLIALLAIWSSFCLSASAMVINPVAARAGLKERICLWGCKFANTNTGVATATPTVESLSVIPSFTGSTILVAEATSKFDESNTAVTTLAPTGSQSNGAINFATAHMGHIAFSFVAGTVAMFI